MHKKVVLNRIAKNSNFLPKNIDDFVVKGHSLLISKVIDNMEIPYY